MQSNYLLYPTKVKELANEIITICDDYKARKISNEVFRDTIIYYSRKVPNLLYNAEDYNPTIKKIIGKNRIQLLDVALEGQQISLLERVD